MTIKISDALANDLLDGNSLKALLDGAMLHVFSGTVPATADEALTTQTLLVTMTNAGDGVTGLTFESAAASRAISKTTAETWLGTIVASGTATFYRLAIKNDDSPDAATAAGDATTYRVQGTVGMSGGADMEVSDTALVDNDANTLGLATYVLRFAS